MSGFDKEAERERLREKYEQDREKREATQRMSELLLQGATMTNRHCDDCGDPIFRYDGREFCPTCQAGGEADEQTEPAVEEAASEQRATENGQTATDARAQSTDAANPNAESADAANPNAESADAANPNAETAAPADRSSEPDASAETRLRRQSPTQEPASADDAVGQSRPQPQRQPRPQARSEETPLSEARASLTRTLVRYAHAAEETDDPRRAKDHLEAAREAAAALSALDR